MGTFNHRGTDVEVSFGGVSMGTLQSVSADIEYDDAGTPRGEFVASPKSFTVSDVVLDIKFAELFSRAPAFDIVVIKKGMPSNRSKMTKNRRIQKKWLKKYGRASRVTYRGCTLIGEADNNATIHYS